MGRPELDGLAKKVAQPYVTIFSECFDDVRRWNHNGGNHQLVISKVGDLTITPFCALHDKARAYHSLSVIPADWIYSRIREGMLDIEDRVFFEVVDHKNGWALVLAQYDGIVGSLWLAYITSASIPKEEIW
jgi:hypothetical protein